MRTHIIYRTHKSWPLPKNRLDERVCPTCKCPVFGSDGQRDHERKHERDDEKDRQFIEAITQICNFLGIKVTIADGDDWEWGAGVTGVEGELASSEDD